MENRFFFPSVLGNSLRVSGCLRAWVVLILLAVLLRFPGSSQAQEVDEAGLASSVTFEISAGSPSRNYENLFFLSETESERGIGWISREVRVTGDLAIVEECLSRNLYYVIVRLAAKPWRTASGTLSVCLRKGPAGSPMPQILPEPEDVKVSGDPLQPEFSCVSTGYTTLFTLYDVHGHEPLWSKAYSGNRKPRLDEGTLEIGHRYQLLVAQSNSMARYSQPATLGFRIIGVQMICPCCNGFGQWLPHDDQGRSREGKKPCVECGGSGVVTVPAISTETVSHDPT